MFNFHDIQQNTDEWLDMRVGLLTSSNLNKIMANYGKAFGEPAKKLAIEIALGQLTGKKPANNYTNEHMQRGHEQEPIARMLYEDETFCTVGNGGFFEDGQIGCSPDGLVNDDGAIEIKSVISSVHFNNVKRQNLDPAYKWQCYGNLKFTGREWLDFISYCEDFPEEKQLFIHRIYAKECGSQFDMLNQRVEEFMSLIEESKSLIINSSYNNV